MEQRDLTEFSGVVGAVVRGSISLTSAVTGFVLGVALIFTGLVFGLVGAPLMGQLLAQVILALFLARFAVNGIYGEYGGTVFSTAGGSWAQVTQVALRYIALTAVWLLPVVLLGMLSVRNQVGAGPGAMPGAMGGMGGLPLPVPGMGKLLFVGSLYILLSTLTPPVFLIVSVSADSFADVFSPYHWRARFSGRTGDLFMVYAAYVGTLGMVALLALPLILSAAGLAWQLAAFVAVVAGVFFAGMMVDLLGRLSGFFAFGEGGFQPVGEVDGAPGSVGAVAVAAPGTSASVPGGEAATVAEEDSTPASVPVSGGLEAATSGLPPLQDAIEHVNTAKRRFASEPDAAIASLEELRKIHAPHPQVLHTLWSFYREAGRPSEALEVAREALPVLVQRGNAGLAAQMFRAHWKEREALKPDRAVLVAVAGALTREEDLAFAANTYAVVLQSDKRDMRAIKGILKIAEVLHREKSNPEDAVRLYRYLLKTAPESPLVEYMSQGLEEAQQKLGQVKAS